LVEGSEFRVQKFRVQGSGFRVQSSEFRVQGSTFRNGFQGQSMFSRVARTLNSELGTLNPEP
jgi:hypothetical protein